MPLPWIAAWLVVAPVDDGWVVPAACPDRAAFEARVARYAIEPPVTPAVVTARIELTGTGYDLDLTVGGQRRQLQAQDCARLVDAAALIVAVTYDPVGVAAAVSVELKEPIAPRESAPTVVTPPVVEPLLDDISPASRPASAEPREREDAPAPSRVQAFVRPEFGFGGPVLPGFGVGLGGVLGLRSRERPWRVELQGAYWFPRTAEAGGVDAAGRFSLAGGSARGCWEPRLSKLSLPACGGVELGAMAGEGVGQNVSTRRTVQVWAAATVGGGLVWAPVPAFALAARAEVLVSLYRPGFHLEGIQTLHRASIVAGRGWLGVEVRFP